MSDTYCIHGVPMDPWPIPCAACEHEPAEGKRFRAPRAPEWVYDRLAGRPSRPIEATADDERLATEEATERSARHSLDGFDPWVVDLG
jgi:hypothetical protein